MTYIVAVRNCNTTSI